MSAVVIEFPSLASEVKPKLAVVTIEHERESEGRRHRFCPSCHAAVPLHLAGCPVELRFMQAQLEPVRRKIVVCSFCEGEGYLPSGTPGRMLGCPECQGRGRI